MTNPKDEREREYWYDILHYCKAAVAIDPRGDWKFLVWFLEGKYDIRRVADREPSDRETPSV